MNSIRKNAISRGADVLNASNAKGPPTKNAVDRAVRVARIVETQQRAQHEDAPKVPGYDGSPPDLRPPENLAEWEKNKDTIPDTNINTDRLKRLMAHGQIDQYQCAAAEKLQKDWHLAEIINYASLTGAGGGNPKNTLSDAKLMAGVEYGKAISKVMMANYEGKPLAFRGEQILRFMILEHNWTAKQMARHWRIREKRVMPILHTALNALVDFYQTGKGAKGGEARTHPYHPFHGER
jgi:hypothetical protein